MSFIQGWIDISHLLNCNKIKELNAKADDIVDSLKTSDKVEVSSDSKKIRRKGNAPLPSRGTDGAKKRDSKAKDKEEGKQEEDKVEDVKYDEKGNPILHPNDFENP